MKVPLILGGKGQIRNRSATVSEYFIAVRHHFLVMRDEITGVRSGITDVRLDRIHLRPAGNESVSGLTGLSNCCPGGRSRFQVVRSRFRGVHGGFPVVRCG